MYELSTVNKENETKVIGILKAKKDCNSPWSPIMFYKILMTYRKRKTLSVSKIEIDGSILEQAKKFNDLWSELSLDGEPNFDKK